MHGIGWPAPSGRSICIPFIGCARSPSPIELMLQNMFVGRPVGNYDRILDFSTAVTGTLFFVPSLPILEQLADGGPADAEAEAGPRVAPDAPPPGALGIGSLRPPPA